MMEIRYDMSLEEVQALNDMDLSELSSVSERDKDVFFRAACTYWMCIMERNRRSGVADPEYMDVKCLATIYDSEHEIIFRVGNKYRLYQIDDTLLIYGDNWLPYIFTTIEDDDRCVWKRFGIWDDDGIGFVN